MKLIGSSYCERVMYGVLQSLGLKFSVQFKINKFKFRYDSLVEDKYIIELHGMQHYDYYRQPNWKTYNEEHENDMTKYDIAVLNGYEYNKNYFVIDCRYTYLYWIKTNISSCKLFETYDLDCIDWEGINYNAQTEIKKEIIELWNNKKENLTTTDIANIYNITRQTVRKYLVWGMENGFCEYSPKDEIGGHKKPVLQFTKDNILIGEYVSSNEASRIVGVSQGNINSCCNGKRMTAGGYVWKFKEDVVL